MAHLMVIHITRSYPSIAYDLMRLEKKAEELLKDILVHFLPLFATLISGFN